VEDFVARLLKREAVTSNPLVASITEGAPLAATERTVQRHFLRTTGLTLKTYNQIARARQALVMLQSGTAPAQAAAALGYADQPHLTRSLRAYMGTTPGQIARASSSDPV
jgi:AraC-like DNA-binding protein